MKTSFVATFLLSALVVFSTSNLNAQQQLNQQQQQLNQQQQQTSQQQQPGSVANAQPQVVKKVGFRMASWRTIHGDGTKATTDLVTTCLLYTSPSPRDQRGSRMPSSA